MQPTRYSMCQPGRARVKKDHLLGIPKQAWSRSYRSWSLILICPSWPNIILHQPLWLSYLLFFPSTNILLSAHEPRLSLLPALPSTDQPIELHSQCSATRATHILSLALTLPTPHWTPVVPSVLAQTRMRIGRRSQILLNDGEFRTGLHSGIIVSSYQPAINLLNLNIDVSSGKKIKRRLEDLERRAGSSSASPEQSHAELVTAVQPRRKTEDGVKRQKSKNEKTLQQQRTSPKRPSSTYPATKEDRSSLYNRQYSREMSASPPPYSNYSYPLPEPVMHTPYPQHAAIHTLPPRFPDFQGQTLYLPPLPVTLPSMSSYDLASVKNECLFDDEDMLSQSYMSYSPLANMDIPTTQSYQDSNVHVNHPEYSFRFQ